MGLWENDSTPVLPRGIVLPAAGMLSQMRITRLSLIGLRLSELAGEVWFRISLGFAAAMLLGVAIL